MTQIPGISSPTSFLELLPAKSYPPPNPIKPSAPLIDVPVGDQVMPSDEMVEATATKRRSSSTSTAYSVATSNDGDDRKEAAFLPLIEVGK